MENKISLSLKILAVYYWSFTPTILLSFTPFRDTALGEMFIRDAQVASYQFELLFALIFFVWGIYLWKASKEPKKQHFFIDFTIWASAVHLLWMIIMAILQPVDTVHLLRDAVILTVPLGLVIYFRFR